ncbi:MAG: hypothetical protein ABJ242_12170 [Marinomonas sp.]
MMDVTKSLIFATEAEMVALSGAGFLLLAGVALLADKLRSKRKDINRVGFMPWTAIFMGSMIIGGGLLALALPRVIGGLI